MRQIHTLSYGDNISNTTNTHPSFKCFKSKPFRAAKYDKSTPYHMEITFQIRQIHTHLLNALKTSSLELLNATKTHPYMANVDYLSQMKYNTNSSNTTNAHPSFKCFKNKPFRVAKCDKNTPLYGKC